MDGGIRCSRIRFNDRIPIPFRTGHYCNKNPCAGVYSAHVRVKNVFRISEFRQQAVPGFPFSREDCE